jgi:hypothetical protein
VTWKAQLQGEVERVAEAVDSLDRTLGEASLFGAVRVPRGPGFRPSRTLRDAVDDLVRDVAALVDKIGEPS